jgi:hypothetical protein
VVGEKWKTKQTDEDSRSSSFSRRNPLSIIVHVFQETREGMSIKIHDTLWVEVKVIRRGEDGSTQAIPTVVGIFLGAHYLVFFDEFDV